MSEFKTIETQSELDAIIKQRVAREREKFADYEQLQSRVKELEEQNYSLQNTLDVIKSDDKKYTSEIEALNQKISGYETTALKQRIALQNGLPFELADRLSGVTEEELLADAEKLSSFIQTTNAPLKDVEPPIQENGIDSAWRTLSQNLK